MTAKGGGQIAGWEITDQAIQRGMETPSENRGIWLGTVAHGRGLVIDSGSGGEANRNYFYNHDTLGPFFRTGDGNNFIKFDNTGLAVSVSNLNLAANNFEISSIEQSMSLGSNKELILDAKSSELVSNAPIIKLQGGEISASNFFVDSEGSVTASKGLIASWKINPKQLISEDGDIFVGEVSGGDGFVLDSGSRGQTGIDYQALSVSEQLIPQNWLHYPSGTDAGGMTSTYYDNASDNGNTHEQSIDYETEDGSQYWAYFSQIECWACSDTKCNC